jgi:glycosyltransferase involved in cell wall biosynthesis
MQSVPDRAITRSRDAIRNFRPDLICVSNGAVGCGLDWMEWLGQEGIRYTAVCQANAEWLWPMEPEAQRWIACYTGAERSYFVSEANRRLFEHQTGVRLANAQIVRNPYQVPYDGDCPWPDDSSGVLRLACVGRINPGAKGQDLVLQVLAMDKWRSRPVHCSFFGDGGARPALERLAAGLGVSDRIAFCGHVPSVESVWHGHHALLLPSRYEGLPIVVVSAMLCGRPVIVTDVAGNREVVDDNVTGFIAAAPSVDSLDEAMERAWVRRAELAAMGQKARVAMRGKVPPNPTEVFLDDLLRMAAPGPHQQKPQRA